MSNSVDPRMHPVKAYVDASFMAPTKDAEIANLQLAMMELSKIVETLLPEPEPPTPTPEDLAAMEASGIESFNDARVKLFGAAVQHPTVARIKFADGGVVGPKPAQSAELTLRHAVDLEAKNAQIKTLETRISFQRDELAVLNGKQTQNAQVMGWLTAIANADKDVEAGVAAGKALSEFAQTLRAA